MLKVKTLIATILMVVIAACSSTHEAKVDFDKNEDINTAQYKTFAWLTTTKILVSSTDMNPVMKLRVDKDIEDAFIARGYKLIDDAEAADFAISYTVGNRDKIKVDSFPTTYHGGWGWGHGRGYYGGYHGGMGTETRVRQYTEGRLAIDIFDVKSHQPAWHGSAVKRITSTDKENPELMIETVVNQVIAQFN